MYHGYWMTVKAFDLFGDKTQYDKVNISKSTNGTFIHVNFYDKEILSYNGIAGNVRLYTGGFYSTRKMMVINMALEQLKYTFRVYSFNNKWYISNTNIPFVDGARYNSEGAELL